MATDAGEAPPFFAVRRLGHVNLFVDDIDRSVAFYREVVGLGVAWRRSNMRTGFHSNGNSHHDIGLIDLHGPLGAGATPALNHLAFELETQVDLVEGYQRALAAGFAFTAMYDHEISHSLYWDDLEGRQIEVYADTDVDWQHRLVNPIKPSLDKWVPGAVPPSPEPHYWAEPEYTRHDDALFHATRVSHAVLAVGDLAAAVAEYGAVLGLRPVWGGVSEGAVSLGGTCGLRDVTLLQAGDGLEPGLLHFGFEAWSEADLKDSTERARQQGLMLHEEHESPWRHSVMLEDPDGFIVQLYADRRPLDAATLPPGVLNHLV